MKLTLEPDCVADWKWNLFPCMSGTLLNNHIVTLGHKSGKKHKNHYRICAFAAIAELDSSHCGQAIHPVFAETPSAKYDKVAITFPAVNSHCESPWPEKDSCQEFSSSGCSCVWKQACWNQTVAVNRRVCYQAEGCFHTLNNTLLFTTSSGRDRVWVPLKLRKVW